MLQVKTFAAKKLAYIKYAARKMGVYLNAIGNKLSCGKKQEKIQILWVITFAQEKKTLMRASNTRGRTYEGASDMDADNHAHAFSHEE